MGSVILILGAVLFAVTVTGLRGQGLAWHWGVLIGSPAFLFCFLFGVIGLVFACLFTVAMWKVDIPMR